MKQLPKRFEKFQKEFPNVANAYEQLGTAVHNSGPLNTKTRALIKLAISTGAGMEGAVHSHMRKAMEAGCAKAEIRQTVMLALPTIGFPASMAVLCWVEDIIEKQ
jgi:alkylhydroperoxidase/carboxymuconolactone decarboxylase family protein YurZ